MGVNHVMITKKDSYIRYRQNNCLQWTFNHFRRYKKIQYKKMSSSIALIAITFAVCSVHTNRAQTVSWAGATCPDGIPEDTPKETLHVFTPTTKPTGYTILTQNVTGRFSIAPNGTLSSATKLDFESDEKGYSLTIMAFTGAENTNQTCKIRVINVNDEKPLFLPKSYSVNIPNNVATGDSLLNVTATDNDVTDAFKTVGYTIKENDAANFTIDPNTGNIKAANNLSGPHTFKLTVVATDKGKTEFTDEASVSMCIGCASGSSSLEIRTFAFMSIAFAVVLK